MYSKLEPPLSEDEVSDVIATCTSNVYPTTDTVPLTVGKVHLDVCIFMRKNFLSISLTIFSGVNIN